MRGLIVQNAVCCRCSHELIRVTIQLLYHYGDGSDYGAHALLRSVHGFRLRMITV